MNRDDFQLLSKMRVAEAKTLLDAGQYTGSRYLMGYAVECALKACIAKSVKRHDFPPRDAATFYVHKLEELFVHAKLRTAFDRDKIVLPALATHWNTVKGWSEQLRYVTTATTEVVARDYYKACVTAKTGVLTWIKKQW